MASPHFSGLHAPSAVVWHVHKGHLAHAPWLCDPEVLVAVTLAGDNLIHLKHTQFSVISSQVPDESGKILHHNNHYIHLLVTFISLHYLKFLESSSTKKGRTSCALCPIVVVDPHLVRQHRDWGPGLKEYQMARRNTG